MRAIYALAIGVLLLAVAPLGSSQEPKKEQAAPKMVEFQMVLLKRGPKWVKEENAETKHIEHLTSLFESGKAVLAGPVTDGGDVTGVVVLRAKSAAEAKEWIDAVPSVASGFHVVEMHPWWSEDIFGKPVMPLKLTKMYLAFLTRGEKWTPERTPATEEIQKGHMANINKLAEMKKLVAAGPFGDNGRLRGIFVFRVASLEEAKALTASDPAVQAGRLAMDIHPWLIPEGVLP